MLVCNISMRPLRRAIASELIETAAADDSATTGFVVFATLVDDPANVRDNVDAYLGEIMLEPASASDAIDAGLVYSAGIDESITAGDTSDGAVPAIYTDTVTEAASAGSSQDATKAAATPYARTLCASRAGLGSVVVVDSFKTQTISNIGAVT